jgi:photosystem II stability/assembly factor-like uncharacterized protein
MKRQRPTVWFAAAGLLSLVYFTQEANAGWTRICQANQLDSGRYITALGVNDTAVFIGTSWGNVFRSSVNGTSWKTVNYLPTAVIDSMWIKSGTPWPTSIAFSGTNIFIGTNFCGIYVSGDQGSTWQPVDIGLPMVDHISDATFFSTSGKDIYLHVRCDNLYHRLFSSENNGISWSALNADHSLLYCRIIAPAGSFIAAGGNYGVYTSTNKGVSWNPANYGLAETRVNCLTVCGNTLFAGTETGIYVSANNGTSWQAANNGIPKYSYISSFSVSGNKIFASTRVGIFLSQDNGASWTDVSDGLSDVFGFLTVNATHLYTYDGDFYNSNCGSNVYSRPLSEMSKVAVPPAAQSGPGIFKIGNERGQGLASISFDLPQPSQVSLSVLSASGKRVATVFDGLRGPGIQNISWSHAGLPAGMYLLCLKTGKRVMVQKYHVL